MMKTQRSDCLRLPNFILANVEPILVEWEGFARGIWPPGAAANPVDLRDHAEAILRASVADMQSTQSSIEQAAKSRGDGGATAAGRRLDTASHRHGADRVTSGFRLAEMIAEYRALRASVVRLWRESNPEPDADDLDDLTRFHESMDQSLAAAIESFADQVDQARRLFLAILGHDLRSPLGAVRLWGQVLAEQPGASADVLEAAASISEGAAAMDRMIADLLDFTASGLGGAMPISPRPTDLHALCTSVVEEVRAAHPERALTQAVAGDPHGQWDPQRLRQALVNLLSNAVQHGSADAPVSLSANDAGERVVITVHNVGPPIPQGTMPMLFDPLRRVATQGRNDHRRSRAGLGLFIAHQVISAHGGTIKVTSTAEAGTTFTLHLPRSAPTPDRRHTDD